MPQLLPHRLARFVGRPIGRAAVPALLLTATPALAEPPATAPVAAVVPAGHRMSCDDTCDGSGRRRVFAPARNRLFGHEHYCPGRGSAPQVCNPTVRRPVARVIPRPIAPPVPTLGPTPPSPAPMAPPIEPAVPCPPADDTGFAMPLPVEGVETVTPNALEAPIEPAEAALPPQPMEEPTPIVPRLDEPEMEAEDAAEDPMLERDPSAPPVPPEAVEAIDESAEPAMAREPEATPSSDDPMAPAASQPVGDGREQDDQPQRPKAPESKSSDGTTSPPASEPRDRPDRNGRVVEMPASGWRSVEEGLSGPDLYFPAGEPDTQYLRHGAGKPFGLYE